MTIAVQKKKKNFKMRKEDKALKAPCRSSSKLSGIGLKKNVRWKLMQRRISGCFDT